MTFGDLLFVRLFARVHKFRLDTHSQSEKFLPVTQTPQSHTELSRRWIIFEISLAFFISVAATITFFQLSSFISFFQENLHTLVGATFVALPMIFLLPRKESLDSYGMPPQPILREILFAVIISALIFPPFVLAFKFWWGWELSFSFRVPDGFINMALANLIVVALPEEFFYRGYLMGRIDLLLKGRIRILGAEVGWSLIIASVLFAIGHFVVTFQPERLAVFFPSLVFGWLRIKRGSITAAVFFHAFCNIFMDFLLIGYGIGGPRG